ncbi:Alpha/Beta hydrolase protein [Mycena vitilis]|nr:Alpha/Beta hydrolase protein [Mycena vitilis]
MAALTTRESMAVNTMLIAIMLVVAYTSFFGRYSKRANGRPIYRIYHDNVSYFVLGYLNYRQLQYIQGTSDGAYAAFAREKKFRQVVDDLGDSAQLMWLEARARKKDHVLIYCHGGGYVLPLTETQIEFWARIQKAIGDNYGVKPHVALLQYTRFPASYPTQLDQLQSAVKHVMSLGVSPGRIYLAGDSAGGNIILQFLSHILHPSPLAAAQPPSRSSGFGGICLVSPWVMSHESPDSERENDGYDLIPAECLTRWQDAYLDAMPDEHRAYVQATDVPEGWFTGVHKTVRRVLVTTGRNEVLRDSIIQLAEMLGRAHPGGVELNVQEDGVHCDPINELASRRLGGKEKAHSTETRIVEWFGESLTGHKYRY